jgi:hypothetical protein
VPNVWPFHQVNIFSRNSFIRDLPVRDDVDCGDAIGAPNCPDGFGNCGDIWTAGRHDGFWRPIVAESARSVHPAYSSYLSV